MPDMLVRLYDLPDPALYIERARRDGYTVRRAEIWDRPIMRDFVDRTFGKLWSVEADRAYNYNPITCFVATKEGAIPGFAVYECTRRGFFGPTGVREDLRGNGIGAALLLRCLEAMREMGYGYAIVGGVGPAEFYEKVCGAFVIPGSEVGIYGPLNEIRQKENA